MTAWSLIREATRRELRGADRFVRAIEADDARTLKQRRRTLWLAVKRRDELRRRLAFVECAIVHNVPFPRELGKSVALAKHYDRSARAAARSVDARPRAGAEKREKRLTVVLTSTEYAALEAQATEIGVPLFLLARWLLTNHPLPRPPKKS